MSANPPNHFDEAAKQYRFKLKLLADNLKTDLHEAAANLPDGQAHDIGEVHANITLAYRHLEDAAMRIGKAIQARDGGISVYDK
jgi:hypothetical protein